MYIYLHISSNMYVLVSNGEQRDYGVLVAELNAAPCCVTFRKVSFPRLGIESITVSFICRVLYVLL